MANSGLTVLNIDEEVAEVAEVAPHIEVNHAVT